MVALQTKKLYRQHLITPKNIVVVFDHGSPVTVPSTNGSYERIKGLLTSGETYNLDEEVDKALRITTSTKGKFVVLNGAVNIDGSPLPPSLSSRLVRMVDANEDTTRLEKFWDNLSQNPTESAREDLYAFLTANNVPITTDGCFVVYRSVRDDFWDHRTGHTFLSTPGSIIKMDRGSVDHNREHTCSSGMHVAAWSYAGNFGGSGSKTMEVKVNPRDVVAVPPDYSQQKMRVCRAEILKEVVQECTDDSYDDEGEEPSELVEVFSSETILPDREGRIRIPGRFLRAIGAGVGSQVEVIVEDEGCGLVIVQKPSEEDDFAFWTTLTVRDDNSVRISPQTLAMAGIEDDASFDVDASSGVILIA
jgi:bifunctional DNA-binding transcriptional regulator/antitoxin component of YhaV-PrlF toxin-antitoxin module